MTEDRMSRRAVLGAAGAIAAGAAFMGLGGPLPMAEARTAKMEKWPWPYVKLDPAETAELAYNEWYRVFCGAAVISSVFTQLRKKVGEPYKSFPVDAFIFLEGGMSGWGTVCGSNAGANIVTNMIIGPRTSGSEDGMLMGSEMLQWYSDAKLPTFTPKEPKIKFDMPTTVSNSPLCHISVGKWMKAADKSLGSPERKDRCARVTGSVAYHLVEMLNDWKDGKYKTQGAIPSKMYGITAQSNCGDCHGSNVPSPPTAKKI
ncbi:MAG: C-GCAxxG-C-C family protein [Nitrospiraceae bacterium]|nr:C-GCAxxG-C-C family protein [Nitrospiraceae bacterium]